jgi:hypothetical protein
MNDNSKIQVLVEALNILNAIPFVGFEFASGLATTHRIISLAIQSIEQNEKTDEDDEAKEEVS